MRSAFLALLPLALSCGGAGADDGGTDADSDVDSDSDSDSDTGPAPCGDGEIGDGEACDGGSVPCADLAASWGDGDATCRDDCRGWDVEACTLADGGGLWESVKPAVRDASRWSGARCNDGTPFTMGVRLSPDRTRAWVVYLQGGVLCDDDAFSCATRDPALTTALPAPDATFAGLPVGGVFSRDARVSGELASANQVFAQYCSSDLWTGATTERRDTDGSPEGWYFSGRPNVRAAIEILVDRYGLDDRDPDARVLFGGGSAGAMGSHFNAAAVTELLPDASADRRVLLFVDAGWLTGWDDPAHRLGAASANDHDVWGRARDFWGGHFDPACEAAEADPVDCFFGPVWYPYLSAAMPIFLQQCEVDSSFMGVHGIAADDTATVEAWRAEVRGTLVDVGWLFSGSAPYHTLGTSDAGLAMGPPGDTLGELLGRFWADGPPERVEF